MPDRQGMEVASGATSLGMLADNALIAILRYERGEPLSERDLEILEEARQLLEAISELGTREVVVASRVRDMAPIGVLDETFRAIGDAHPGDSEDLAAGILWLQSAIDEVLAGGADNSTLIRLRAFFDRLGDITLARADLFARPGREQRENWIRQALDS